MTNSIVSLADRVAICVACEAQTPEQSNAFPAEMPACPACGEDTLYTAAEVACDPDYYGYGMADWLESLGL